MQTMHTPCIRGGRKGISLRDRRDSVDERLYRTLEADFVVHTMRQWERMMGYYIQIRSSASFPLYIKGIQRTSKYSIRFPIVIISQFLMINLQYFLYINLPGRMDALLYYITQHELDGFRLAERLSTRPFLLSYTL